VNQTCQLANLSFSPIERSWVQPRYPRCSG